ncbi:MAG: DUF2723 domain-containing protein [Deltaproteobacteria bacterium]|nr:DUF2723 domain-containing protein [Deltaproteobacteria bacterium]
MMDAKRISPSPAGGDKGNGEAFAPPGSDPAGWILPFLPGVLIAVAFFVLYARGAAPTVLNSDAAEMQVLAWQPGIAHSIGYPFYVWIAGVSRFLPFGDIAHRVNILSAIFCAASLFLLYRLAFRLCSGSLPLRTAGAATAAFSYGFSYTLWDVSLYANMYSLQVFVSLGVVCLSMLWTETGRRAYLYTAAFLYGTMAGIHLTIVGLLPALALLILIQPSSRRPGLPGMTCAGGLAALGAAFGHVFLFWLLWQRHSPFDHWHKVILTNLDLFPVDAAKADRFWFAWWFCIRSAQHLATGLHQAWTAWGGHRLQLFPMGVVCQFFPVFTLIACIGFVTSWRKWRISLFLTALLLFPACLASYLRMKLHLYSLVPYGIVSLFLGMGIVWLGERLKRILEGLKRSGISFSRGVQWIAVAVLVALLFGANQASRNGWIKRMEGRPERGARPLISLLGPRPDRRHEYRHRVLGRSIADNLAPHAVVFVPWRYVYLIEYVCRVERNRADVSVYEANPYPFSPSGFSEANRGIIGDTIGRRPIYLAQCPDGIVPYRSILRAPGLWELVPEMKRGKGECLK